jgi:aspartokinase-like uncharacterized kinase
MLTVVKVGGSLLASPDMADRLRLWLAAQPAGRRVLIAGGGAVVDALRELDRAHPLDEAAAHWMSVDLMSVTARVLGALVPEFPLVVDWKNLPGVPAAGATTTAVFDAGRFLRAIEPRAAGTKLPASWDVTSDSIAARLAVVAGAGRLVLLKSARPPASDWASLADRGYVDRFFPRLVGEAPPAVAIELLRGEPRELSPRAASP